MAKAKKKTRKKSSASEKIVIDSDKGLSFDSEDELYQHFYKEISGLEQEFFDLRPKTDIPEYQLIEFEENLNTLIESPDEVWRDDETLEGTELAIYIRKFKSDLYHVAVVYLTEDMPSFVYLHFPTNSEILVGQYRRGEKMFDRKLEDGVQGAVEGDALYEGDEFAMGLYSAMMKLRSDDDIQENDFQEYAELREESIEEPDEIWRSNDTMGNVLVTFIKEYSEEDEALFYIVITVEDLPSGSHALLFSFPTSDEGLVARYRHGENLQAEEVVQEASH